MHRRDRISRADAERLLDTGVGAPQALEALLAAVTPSAAPGELAGERLALTEFRATHLATVPARRRSAMLKPVLANLAAAKVALAATAAAAATGGVALVAATGNLPSTAQGGGHSNHHAPIAVTASANRHRAVPTRENKPTREQRESETAHPTATPSPSLDGLCKAFQAGATDNPGKALNNPAFSVLVAKAGGKDKVADFCVTLVGPASTHPAGAPTTHPTGPPASHPGARPTHPTGAPKTHPTGPPISRGPP